MKAHNILIEVTRKKL